MVYYVNSRMRDTQVQFLINIFFNYHFFIIMSRTSRCVTTEINTEGSCSVASKVFVRLANLHRRLTNLYFYVQCCIKKKCWKFLRPSNA